MKLTQEDISRLENAAQEIYNLIEELKMVSFTELYLDLLQEYMTFRQYNQLINVLRKAKKITKFNNELRCTGV